MFQLAKTYGTGPAPYRRTIAKPVAESVRVAVDGVAVPAAQVACEAATAGSPSRPTPCRQWAPG